MGYHLFTQHGLLLTRSPPCKQADAGLKPIIAHLPAPDKSGPARLPLIGRDIFFMILIDKKRKFVYNVIGCGLDRICTPSARSIFSQAKNSFEEETIMKIVVSEEKGRVPVTILAVEGEIDAASYQELQQQVEEALSNGTLNLILDLNKVTFVSSSGLRAIHHIYSLLRDWETEGDEVVREGMRAGTYHSPHLKLVNPSRIVHDVLKQSGFDMFLEIHDDLQRAVASFS
jgi:anti-anti-sigma factor